MITEEKSINIRAIQHYMYCPRRFALLEINSDWAENASVIRANLIHEAVHSGEHQYKSKEKAVYSSVVVYNDDYDIFGVTDCIEFVKSKNGVLIKNLEGRYKVRIIEYKPTSPKDCDYHESDAIQVFAQKICADYVWGGHSEAYIYYSDKRRRVRLPFDEVDEYERYNSMVSEFLMGMKKILETNSIPRRRKSQKCSGCSLSDYCFPKVKKFSVSDTIRKLADG